jgi:hypothetical protein
METTKAVKESKVAVEGVATMMALVQGDLTSQANMVPSQLTEIQQHLQRHVRSFDIIPEVVSIDKRK